VPTSPIARPAPELVSAGLAPYVAQASGDDVRSILEAQADEVPRRLRDLPEAKALLRYAPGKWSVKEVLGHLCDAERVYGYRMLRFARADATELPGFDEDRWVPQGRFDARPVADLVDEWRSIRLATRTLLDGLPADALDRGGVANGWRFTVRTIAWLAAGHTAHHLRILAARYGVG
jgi:hypothetical protein